MWPLLPKMVLKKEVWMNGNAQWVMTNTDLQTTDQLTPNVYNDFYIESIRHVDCHQCKSHRIS